MDRNEGQLDIYNFCIKFEFSIVIRQDSIVQTSYPLPLVFIDSLNCRLQYLDQTWSCHIFCRFPNHFAALVTCKIFLYILCLSWITRMYLLWTLERECARTLGEGTPLWAKGGPGPQWEAMSVSWVWTGKVRRHNKMSGRKEDYPIMTPRDDHAQSKCHRASINNNVNICHKHCACSA